MKTNNYQNGTIVNAMEADDLFYFRVSEKQSDLYIGAEKPLQTVALEALREIRTQVEIAVATFPAFATSLVPLPPQREAGPVVMDMYVASGKCQVGPMAAVAGAIAQAVGRALRKYSRQVIVENGGDVYMYTDTNRSIGVYAGESPFTGLIAVQIPPGEWGICTSSGRIGPSFSFGKAHAAMVLSHDATFADAAATALGNLIHTCNDLDKGVSRIMTSSDSVGALAIIDDRIAVSDK